MTGAARCARRPGGTRVGLALGLVSALALGATTASACPVCFAASGPRAAEVYYLSTVMLSLLPFAVVASIIAVARRLSCERRDAFPAASAWHGTRFQEGRGPHTRARSRP